MDERRSQDYIERFLHSENDINDYGIINWDRGLTERVVSRYRLPSCERVRSQFLLFGLHSGNRLLEGKDRPLYDG